MRRERGSQHEGSWSRNNANGAKRRRGVVARPTFLAPIPPFPSPSNAYHIGHSSFCSPAPLVKVLSTPAIVYLLLRAPNLPLSSLKLLAFFSFFFFFFFFFMLTLHISFIYFN